MHDNPERRALAQPRNEVAASAGGGGPARLAHHAGAHAESHVRLVEVPQHSNARAAVPHAHGRVQRGAPVRRHCA